MRDGISDWSTITQWVVNSFQPTERLKGGKDIWRCWPKLALLRTKGVMSILRYPQCIMVSYIIWGDVFKKYDCDSSNSIDMSEVKNVGTWQKQTMYCTCLYTIVYPCCWWSWNLSFCIAICFEHLSYMKAVTSHWFYFCKVIKDLGFTIAQKTVDELVYEVRANDCRPKFPGKSFHVFSFRFIWYNNTVIYYRYRYMICIMYTNDYE